jgi:hypothetical protein
MRVTQMIAAQAERQKITAIGKTLSLRVNRIFVPAGFFARSRCCTTSFLIV